METTKRNRGPSEGGKVRAIQQREEALRKYYSSPNICKYCESIIYVPTGGKVAQTRIKKFCDRKCAASYNNSKSPKKEKLTKTRRCISCSKQFAVKRMRNGRFNKKNRCKSCEDANKIDQKTKKEFFSSRCSWQSARNSIRNHASKIYKRSQEKKCCMICGYDKHYEVSHIKPVAKFDDSATISEINHIDNLIALCPNHHWEYDNGLLSIK